MSTSAGSTESSHLLRAAALTDPLRRSAKQLAGEDPVLAAQFESAARTFEGELEILLAEHTGMAEELLRVYEQLGVVFDVTRRMLTLRNEEEVLSLFVDSLRPTYPDVQFLVVREGADGSTSRQVAAKRGSLGESVGTTAGDDEIVTCDGANLPAWIQAGVRDSVDRRGVCVVDSGEVLGRAADGASLHAETAAVAAVFAGDRLECVLVLWRGGKGNVGAAPAGQPPAAPDMPALRSGKAPGVRPWVSGDMLLLDSLVAFCGDVIQNFRLLRELQRMSMETVRTLVNAVDQKDPYTSGHSNRVGYYAKLLAKELGHDEDQLETLEWSALLHDIGKIGIRDDVLKKPGKLTEAEFNHIKEHPLRGYTIVRENPYMRAALDGVLHHHEHYDGSGYPEGLQGEAIPLQARIIQIADVFDALTTTRSYRSEFDWRRALDILEKESGSVVDPGLASTFVAMIRRLHARNPAAFEVIGDVNASLCLTES